MSDRRPSSPTSQGDVSFLADVADAGLMLLPLHLMLLYIVHVRCLLNVHLEAHLFGRTFVAHLFCIMYVVCEE